MALPASDAFAGTGALSGSWTQTEITDVISVISDTAQLTLGSGQGAVFWNADAFAASHYAEIVFHSAHLNEVGPAVRVTGTDHTTRRFYGVFWDGTDTILGYWSANSGEHDLASSATDWVAGDTMRLEIDANFGLTVKKNGVSVLTYDDAGGQEYAGGSAGCHITGSGEIASWGGGNVGGAAGGGFVQEDGNPMGYRQTQFEHVVTIFSRAMVGWTRQRSGLWAPA